LGTEEMLTKIEPPQRVVLAIEHGKIKFLVARHGGAFIVVFVGNMVGR
jgi:hypothetical protein